MVKQYPLVLPDSVNSVTKNQRSEHVDLPVTIGDSRLPDTLPEPLSR